ncbi:MAG: glycosyltransferase family 4 protein, partial [Chloroflexi bacterium]|nr:glycosyltransferase family 4 protein [Chloroflexota bacterium]
GRALAHSGGADELVVLQSRRGEPPIVEVGHVSHRRLWTPPHHRWEQATLPLELLGAGLDLLHSPDFIPPFRARFPTVITVHDLGFRLYPEAVTADSRRYYGQIDRAVQHAAAIIAVSESTRRDLVDRANAPADRIRVIYEAADEAFRPLDRSAAVKGARTKLGVEGSFILFVGTVEPRKNLPTLLRALTAPEVSSVRLVVAGSRGWLSDEVFRLVEKLHLRGRVQFLGHTPPDDVVTLYNAADAVAYPSLYEGFGLPVVEAMACGTPVVCSNTSSLPEVAGDAALLVEPLDVAAWAKAVARVLEDRALRLELREKGLRRAAVLSWKRAARETLEVYREVAAG